MTLRELLKNSNIQCIVKYFKNTLAKENTIDDMLLEAKLSSLIKELIDLPNIHSDISTIVVEKEADMNLENEIYYYYCVTCIDLKDNEYSLMGIDVREFIDAETSHSSLEKYDIQTIIAAILFEICWFGYSVDNIDRNRKKFTDELLNADV